MANGPSTRLLVVDDERTIADTLGTILHAAGFETKVAYSGTEAISTAAEFRPDIVLADYAMPGMDGMEACARMKKMLPALRVVLLSGHPLANVFEPYEVKGYKFLLLSKPMHPADLIRVIGEQQITAPQPDRRLRVLNVDDVEQHRYSITRLLKHAGFDVTEATTGTDALRHAIDAQPDLILLDVHLPDLNGYDVCTALRQNPKTADIAVLHVTASATEPESKRRSEEVGANGFVQQPFLPSTFVKTIREILQLRYLQSNQQ